MAGDLERRRLPGSLIPAAPVHDVRIARMQDAVAETVAAIDGARKVAAAGRAAQHSATARFLRDRFLRG